MPYINLKTTIGDFPFLIDTGANINLIHPMLANNYSLQKPYYFEANNIGSANGKFKANKAIDINFFHPKIDHYAQFLLHDFHPFFHGIIGTGVLNALNAKLDLGSNTLQLNKGNESLNVSLLQYSPQQTITKASSIISHQTTPHEAQTACQANPTEHAYRTAHLSSLEKEQLLSVLNRYEEVFHKPDAKLTCSTVVECSINTVDEIPIHQKVYPYPAAYAAEVNKQVDQLLQDGIIRPSRSAWTSPVWIVPKKSDASGEKKFRMVVDYRKLNEKTISDRYPMPEINYVIDQLKGQQYFITLDLASGFHQIKMKEGDIEKTAFSINNGKYEFTRMPFGLKNAPAIFQRAIDDVLREHIGKICYVYIDDVIIFGKSLDEVLKNLEIILKALNNANLKIQLDKSEFLHKEIEFLGYVITADGLKPNIKKIEAIEKYPEPTTIKELRSFLGMMGYYRRFVKDFAKIAKPLTNLLRGEGCHSNKRLKLTEGEQTCFKKMKSILSSSDILIYPDYNRPFTLTTDASDFAVGAVLSQGEAQNDKPIHFASRTLSHAEEKYSVPEKEMLAIYWALQTFRNYLYGTKFKILTDHQPLTFSLSSKNTNAKLKRWKSYLEEHDYSIEYKPGKSNVVADALSRIIYSMTGTQHSAEDSDHFYIKSTEAPINVFRHQLILKQGPDKVITEKPFEKFTRIIVSIPEINEASLLQVLKNHLDISKLNGILTTEQIMGTLQEVYKKHFGNQKSLKVRFAQYQLLDVQQEDEQWEVIRKEHHRAHRGAEENKLQLLRKLYFPKLSQKLHDFVKNCQICHESKYDRNPIHFPLQKTPIPNQPFQIAHIDILFIDNLQYLTYVDKFSKYAQARLIASRAAVDLIPAVKDVLSKFKFPDTLVMDQEKSFMTGELVNFYNTNKITPYIVATGRSEMNGVVERFHSTLLEIYRISKAENPGKPPEQLMEMSVIKYNNTIHSATKYTPFEIVIPSSNSSHIIETVHKNLLSTQTKDLERHNRKTKHVTIETGIDAYEKTRRRIKTTPRYKKIRIAKVNKSTIRTDDGRRVHKNDLKIRKI